MQTYNKKEQDELNAIEAELRQEALKADLSADGYDSIIDIKEADAVVEAELAKLDTSDSDDVNTEKNKEVSESDEAVDESANEATEKEVETEEPSDEAKDSEEVESEKDAQDKSDEIDSEVDSDGKKLSKKEKERLRKEKSWKNLEAQKQQLAKEKEEIQKQRQEIEESKKQVEEKKQKAEDKKPSSKDYEDLASWYEEKGEYDKAEMAKEAAKTQRDKEFHELQSLKRNTVEAQNAFKAEWTKTVEKVLSQPDYKELHDVNTPFSKKVTEVISRDPRISQFPDGFEIAVHIAKGELAVASLADKDKRIAELETKIKELNKKTQLSGSGANQRSTEPSTKRYKSLDDEWSDLKKEARLADARGGR
jgi:hypothetical protein